MKIFISRILSQNSPLRQHLSAQGYAIYDESLIEFEEVLFNYFPPCHWIFFYSPRGVEYFFRNADPKRYAFNKWAVIGGGTARALIQKGIVPDFIGNGNPEQTAESFADEAFEQRVLFPQASNSRQSVGSLIADQCEVINLVVYNNFPRTDFEIPPCTTLVFTSPLNAKAYFDKYEVSDNQRIIAIGGTTAEALKNRGLLKVEIAKTASEAGLAAMF